MRTSRWPFVLAASAGLMTGCAAKNDGNSGVTAVPREQADEMSAQHARFDNARDPKPTAQTHYAAGRLAESQGAIQQAVAQYQHALAADPKHVPSLYRLGVLHAQSQAYPAAIDAWTRYLKLTSNDATAWSNLGYCHELAGQPAQAEEAYRQAILRDPKSAPCRINYGLMLARLGREQDAITQLQVVLPPAQVYYNLASSYEQQGRNTEAKTYYHKALDQDSALIEARERLANLR